MTFQVFSHKFSNDTQKKILELSAHGGDDAPQSSIKGAEEQKQEGSDNRRSSPYKKRSKRWDLRGEDEGTQK